MTKARRKFRNRSLCILEPHLIESDAFMSLSGKAAMLVLVRFYQKVYRKRTSSRKRNRIQGMVITNNGEIVFSYAEAREFGLTDKTFSRVLHELVEDKGFIDVSEHGNWYMKEPTKFAISERWRKYGTPEYSRVEMPRILPEGLGFKKGNQYGERKATKTKHAVIHDSEHTVTHDTEK